MYVPCLIIWLCVGVRKRPRTISGSRRIRPYSGAAVPQQAGNQVQGQRLGTGGRRPNAMAAR